MMDSDQTQHKNEINNLKNDFALAIEHLASLTLLKEWIILDGSIDGAEATRNDQISLNKQQMI